MPLLSILGLMVLEAVLEHHLEYQILRYCCTQALRIHVMTIMIRQV
ncbi:hypothetical protein GLYMA_06G239751v4 [Glycine max]|nr:hypothetical protein GLYMA_06G239751v4 [Glycine max]KAH1127372.1 hypothetical protein GYH30_016097 [Glycine max]